MGAALLADCLDVGQRSGSAGRAAEPFCGPADPSAQAPRRSALGGGLRFCLI